MYIIYTLRDDTAYRVAACFSASGETLVKFW